MVGVQPWGARAEDGFRGLRGSNASVKHEGRSTEICECSVGDNGGERFLRWMAVGALGGDGEIGLWVGKGT